jgi:hypothetical protein
VDNRLRYLIDPVFHAMVDTVAHVTINAVEEADANPHIGRTRWENRERAVKTVLLTFSPETLGIM